MDVINSIMEETAIIVGDDKTVYLNFTINDVVYTLPINDDFTQTFLRERCREIADDDTVQFKMDYIQPYIDKAVLYGKRYPIFHRLRHTEASVEYALWDKKHRIIQVNNDGSINVCNETNTFFVPQGYMKPQPMPKKTKDSLEALLAPYINLDENDFVLFLCSLITMFISDISHYAIFISSDYGCGKTTLTNIISELVDNSINGATVMPSRVEDIKVNMASHYLVSFDNTVERNIKEVSDLIAASITGASYRKRKLYSDLAEVNVKLHNICLINGIDILDQNKDLLSRSLVLQPLKLTAENRMTDKDFWDGFHADKPKILFKIFKTVGKVLRIRDCIAISSHERMADAYKYMILAGIALGYDQEVIEGIILDNRRKINELANRNEDGIVSMVSDYVSNVKGNSITSSVTGIYKEIWKRYNPEDYGVERFPASASAFSRKLSELQTQLLDAGISFVKTTKKNYTQLTLCNTASKSKRAVVLDDEEYHSPLQELLEEEEGGEDDDIIYSSEYDDSEEDDEDDE